MTTISELDPDDLVILILDPFNIEHSASSYVYLCLLMFSRKSSYVYLCLVERLVMFTYV
jgi:hypothetical protein